MRKSRVYFIIIAILLFAFPCLAQELSSTPPSMPPEENPPAIDSFTITGSTQFGEDQLTGALTQQVGGDVTILGVQADLRAIAALYYEDPAEMTEGWAGFGLATPRVKVTPEIAHPAEGHVTIEYIVEETAE